MSSTLYGDLCSAGRVELPNAAARGTVFSLLFVPPAEDESAKATEPKYLVAGTSSGRIAVYHVPDVLSKSIHLDASGGSISPHMEWKAHEGAVYTMRFMGTGASAMLLSGGDDGRVLGWSWRALEAAMAPGTQAARRPVPATFQVNLPQQRGVGGALGPVAEVNDLACDAKQARVFAAAGDGNAYAWDMGAGRLVASFSGGHSDMLHCIALRPAHHQAVTGSEDGTCCVWDVRSGSHTKLLDLSRTSVQALPCFRGTASGGVPAAGGGATVTSRVGDAGVAAATRATPQGAHWVGAMATDTSQDWLFLGAGSSSSAGGALITCSMHAMAPVTAIATDAPVHALAFGHDQQVITGGAGPLLHAYGGINLAHQHSWKTSSSSLFAVAEHSSKLVAVGGRGGFVDIFTDYGSVMATFQCS